MSPSGLARAFFKALVSRFIALGGKDLGIWADMEPHWRDAWVDAAREAITQEQSAILLLIGDCKLEEAWYAPHREELIRQPESRPLGHETDEWPNGTRGGA